MVNKKDLIKDAELLQAAVSNLLDELHQGNTKSGLDIATLFTARRLSLFLDKYETYEHNLDAIDDILRTDWDNVEWVNTEEEA